MTGCRHNAKNTLVKNYLYLAEANGAVVLPLTTVTRVRPRESAGYDVQVRFTKANGELVDKVIDKLFSNVTIMSRAKREGE